jgi:hypothetical protein
MKEYMLLVRKKGDSQNTLPPGEFVKFLKSCELYIESLKNQGKLISAQPIAWAGKIISRDGFTWNEVPYSETGEVIGGYYHILAENINEAIEIAKANPEFTFNENTRIEVRPVKVEEEQTGFVYPSETT